MKGWMDGCAQRSVRGMGQIDFAHACFPASVHVQFPAQTAKHR